MGESLLAHTRKSCRFFYGYSIKNWKNEIAGGLSRFGAWPKWGSLLTIGYEAEGEGGRSAYAYEGKGKKMKYEVTMSYTYEVDSDNIERSLLTLEFPEFTYGEGEYLEGNSSWKEIN